MQTGNTTTFNQDAHNEALEDAHNEARDLAAAVDTDKTPPPESAPASPLERDRERERDRAGGVIDTGVKGWMDYITTLDLNQAKAEAVHPSDDVQV